MRGVVEVREGQRVNAFEGLPHARIKTSRSILVVTAKIGALQKDHDAEYETSVLQEESNVWWLLHASLNTYYEENFLCD